MKKTVVIDAVGLTSDLIGAKTPRLLEFLRKGKCVSVGDMLPAVTCSVQATYVTGVLPSEHGIVGNGWYFRDECEIKFWRQSNALVQHEKIWETARRRDPKFTCANLFWWYAMYAATDVGVTPRPMYPSDGRKLPDVWTHPPDLRQRLQESLGQFPLFNFWGPATSIASTQWIANAAMHVDRHYDPTLTLIYLPHLDYAMQRLGPDDASITGDLGNLDSVCGQLLDYYANTGANVIILSEYGIAPVSRPVHLNRVLRQHGFITVRQELGRELLDAGASAAFAVADHQVAHIYVKDLKTLLEVRALVESTEGVAQVLDDEGKRAAGLDHPRAGNLVALAEPDAWFTYYYWLEDARMPDFARTVDIHRKPGYDPAELFIDPKLKSPKLKIAATLLKKKIGFRSLMEVIPPDGAQVRGSHGLAAAKQGRGPMLMTNRPELLQGIRLEATEVRDMILKHLDLEEPAETRAKGAIPAP